MYIKICEICGKEYNARHKSSLICDSCNVEMYKSMNEKAEKQLTHINQGIIEAVKEATALGMSYGEYMAYPLRRRRKV